MEQKENDNSIHDEEFGDLNIDENGIESNLDYIVNNLCSQPPLPVGTVKFGMAHETDMEIEYLESEILFQITLKIMRKLFGEDITPDKMSIDDFNLLNKYINSLNYDMFLSLDENETEKHYKIKFTQIKKQIY